MSTAADDTRVDLSTLLVHGPFRLEVTWIRDAAHPQRLTVTGSDNSDGEYDAEVGMTLDISGAAWLCGSIYYGYGGRWSKSYWTVVDYAVRIPQGLVILLQGQNLMPAPTVGIPGHTDIHWTLTSTNPDTALPPITGSRPDFSLGEELGASVGVAAAQVAAGTTFVDPAHP
jgi:hypothetical protein